LSRLTLATGSARMERTVNIVFGGSWVGVLIAIGLLVSFYKWTGNKWVVAVVAVFLLITRFTFITVEPQSGGDDRISVVGESGNK
jgi:hypothetical protein